MRKITLFLFVFMISIISFGQYAGSYTYDFTDGTIITNGQSDDGSLTLGGTYSHHGTTYGMNMKANSEINISVSGSCSFKFLGSAYSSLSMIGTASEEGDLGTQATKVETDLTDTYDFVYDGDATTLNFKAGGEGSDVYLPSIEIIPEQNGADTTVAAKNVIYYFDLCNGSIIPNETSLNGNYTIEQGLFKIECGPTNGYGYNGSTHGSILKTGNTITLQVAGNSYIKIGGCQYSNGTIDASSETGEFDIASQASQTSECYHNDASTVDFLYVGEAGTVTLTFTGTTYIPIIKVIPVTHEVELNAWEQKAGTVTLNGTTISYTAGETSTDAPTVTVTEGTVVSTTSEMASLRINLAGDQLASFTPTVTGDIASTEISGDSLTIVFAESETNPQSYTFVIADNSSEVKAEAGKTYTYAFNDGSELPQTSYSSLRYTTFVTSDGILTLNSNTDTESLQFGYHDSSHGAVFFSGNSMNFIVAGDATITFGTCQYGSATDAVFNFTDANGNSLGSCEATSIADGECGTRSFTYTGSEGTITATLVSAEHPTAEIYIHGVTIENSAEIEESNGLVDVWDFGAEALDTTTYNNQLTEDIINSWYDESITVASSSNVLPSFTAGVLSWIGGSNDRLRTTNTNLTRYDENISNVEGYTGRIYVNSSAATSRYMSLTLSEDDEVTIIGLSQNGSGKLNFEYVGDPTAQTDQVELGSDITEINFVAKADGTYHIFDTNDKPSYFRIYRKDATYLTLTGNVDISQAEGIPEGYSIVFTNNAGKAWQTTVSNNTYSIKIPTEYTYSLSLADANGYIINNGTSVDITDSTSTYDISIKQVELYEVTGSIIGIEDISNLALIYTPDSSLNKIFSPEPVVDIENSTYTVSLEPDCQYTISAKGVNDYYIPENTITVTAATAADITFAAKPVYAVTIAATGLTEEQLAKLSLTFTNLKEDGYQYTVESIDSISLRSGTYSITYTGLDEYPVDLALTSNLEVADTATTKNLTFAPICEWSFADESIVSGDSAYKGLLFTGAVSNEVAKGHLVAKTDATIKIPVSIGNNVIITYYYKAAFTIEGTDSYTTSSKSTSTLEYATYSYTGTEDGYVTVTIDTTVSTTYITNIQVVEAIAYQAEITVGTDKNYQTINAALDAVSKMTRENNERVTIVIDPGNYEEMLVINLDSITLKNASTTPNIAITNAGVDIDENNAVRITSYYGHGYNYYSMGNDQKWNEEILTVNKENGYLSYENKGSGTTNGSYWNATVVVNADGFEAEHIIFENSFNQYISEKESKDIVVEWESGSKGTRPTTYGSTEVQDRTFVERAAAIAFAGADKAIMYNCRVVGRQDSFYGASGRVVVYKGAMMGAVDYIFGAMTAVFYKTDLVMNVSDASNDAAYLTAAQQEDSRGYLMYECNVTSTEPGTESASIYKAKPGYFGRPWQATTSEVVFFNTTIETTNYEGYEGSSLIMPEGWKNTLGGESNLMYEYGTVEESGADNQASRVSWSTILSEPTLSDGTKITTYNFTKGDDEWDPIPALIAGDDGTKVASISSQSDVSIYSYENQVYITNVSSNTKVAVYSINGALVKSIETLENTSFELPNGLWIVTVAANDGKKAVKVYTK